MEEAGSGPLSGVRGWQPAGHSSRTQRLNDAQRQWKGVEVRTVDTESLLLESMLSPSRHPKDIYGFCAAFTAA